MAAAIDFSYSLEEEEIYKSLKYSGLYKTTGKRAIIENAVLFAMGAMFVASYFQSRSNFNLIIGIICFIFIGVIAIVPTADMKSQAKKQAGKEIKMHLTMNKMIMKDDEDQWTIPLDGTSKCRIVDNEKLILIITPDKQLISVPVRALPADRSYEIQSRIYEGSIQDN